MAKTIDKIINTGNKNILPIALAVGIGVGGYLANTKSVYAGENKEEVSVSQDFDSQEVWENREEHDIYKGYVVFTAQIGEGKNKQKELFIGNYLDNKVSNIKRLTQTSKSEFLPAFLDELTIVFGRSPKYQNYDGVTLDKIIKAPNEFFTTGTDGSAERKADYHQWLQGVQKIIDKQSSNQSLDNE